MDSTDYTPAQFDNEYRSFRHSADWELANVRKALNIMSFLNTSQQWARLAAVTAIQKERKHG